MGTIDRNYQTCGDISPLLKHITQDAINLFEGSAGHSGPSQFTDEETARETLGTGGTVASGRMTMSFAIEMLRKHFGRDVYNHSGIVDLRFLRPVRPGDTINFSGKITETARVANGCKVSVDINASNQNGYTVAVGTGSAVVPSAFLAPED